MKFKESSDEEYFNRKKNIFIYLHGRNQTTLGYLAASKSETDRDEKEFLNK